MLCNSAAPRSYRSTRLCPSNTRAPPEPCAKDGGGAGLPHCSSLHPAPCPPLSVPFALPSPPTPPGHPPSTAALPSATSPTPAARNSWAWKARLSPSILQWGKRSPWGQHRGTSRACAPSTTHGPQPGTLPAVQPRVSAASLRAFRFAFQTCQSRLLPSRRSQMWLNCFSQNFPNTKFQPKADAAHRKFFSPQAKSKVVSNKKKTGFNNGKYSLFLHTGL